MEDKVKQRLEEIKAEEEEYSVLDGVLTVIPHCFIV